MKNNTIWKGVYYSYFTEYLLFSNQYASLIEEGLLDFEINTGYLSFLNLFVAMAIETQWYPLEIIERLTDFILKLKEHVQEEEAKKRLVHMEEDIYETEWVDSTEVYHREYLSRYATIASSKKYEMIPVGRLILDIQNDFKYLNALTIENHQIEIDIGEDFLFFLNKLMNDYPEVTKDKKMRNKIISILKRKNFVGTDKYMHLLLDKTNYAVPVGFDLKRVECFYFVSLIKKLLYSKNVEEELKNIPLFYFYQESFLSSLFTMIEDYQEINIISKSRHNNLRQILYYIKENMDKISLDSKNMTLSILNQGLGIINTLTSSETNYDYVREYEDKLQKHTVLQTYFVFLNDFKTTEAKEHIDYLISLTPEILDYLLDKKDDFTFSTRNPIYESEIGTNYQEEDILRVLENIFKNYPRMFFDDTIYKKALDLLEKLEGKGKQKLKNKIYKIRKDS